MSKNPIRRIKIDWRNHIRTNRAASAGRSVRYLGEWVIKDGDDLNHICIIDPPETAENEELRIEGNEWVVYGKEEK
jgi:hypothetical protein